MIDSKIIQMDILKADDPIIGHCCNTRNTMASGVARALKDRFPEVYVGDTNFHKEVATYGEYEILGNCILVDVVTDAAYTPIKKIANIYGQRDFGYDGKRYLDYEALYNGLEILKRYISELGYKSLGLPYNIGCCRAGGDWGVVSAMLDRIFLDAPITLNLYKI